MNKKIAFVVSSLDLGGAQRAVSNITLSLPKEYDIDIILNNDSNIVYPYRGNIHSLNIQNPKDRTKLLFQAKVFWKRIRYLKRIKKNNKYDAVISFLDSANVANILSGNAFGKTIISVRTNISRQKSWKYKYIVGILVRLFYNRADQVVALSDGVRHDLVGNYKIKSNLVKTIYNGFDVANIRKRSKERIDFCVDKRYTNFVSMGRLSQPKGQWHLIRAFAELNKSNSNTRLYIM